MRARYNDFNSAERLELDWDDNDEYGYLTAPTLNSKTQRTAAKKTTFLPMTGPSPGITRLNWAKRLLDEREAQGISKFRWILPTPTKKGGWIDYPTDVSTAGRWLRVILTNAGHTNLSNVGTHSLKVTALSWAAKHGSIDITERALLGYHVPGVNLSAITYSRDALAAPLMKLGVVFDAIRDKKFFPDCTRSGRFVTNIKRAKVQEEIPELLHELAATDQCSISAQEPLAWQFQEPLLDEAESDLESSDSRSASSSSSDESADLDTVATSVLAKHRLKNINMKNCNAYVHAVSGMLHYKLIKADRLRCGRTLSGSFERRKWEQVTGFSNCIQCFASLPDPDIE